MLITERKPMSRQQREGMIAGYLQCLQLIADESLEEIEVPFTIDDRTDALYPPAYLDYREEWYMQGATAIQKDEPLSGCPGLSYRKWRELAAELQEDAALHAMFDYPPGPREAGLRAMLLLPVDQPLPACLSDLAPETETQQGLIAAYETCRSLTDFYPYDNDGLGKAIKERLYGLLPRDYLEYCRRFSIAAAWYGGRNQPAEPLDFPAWREVVASLQEEAGRCAEQQRPPSRRYQRLRRQLLLVEGEPDPTPFDQNDGSGVQ